MDKPQTETTEKKYKVLRIIVNVIVYVFFALCVLLLVLAIVAKRSDDGATNLFGRETRIVITESMAKSDETDVSGFKVKSIPKGSMVFIKKAPVIEYDDQGNLLYQDELDEWCASLEVGDVLTIRYVYATQETITHRITEIRKEEVGGYYIKVEGDNGGGATTKGSQEIYTSPNHPKWQYGNYVLGKVTGQSKVLGFAVSSMKRPLGIALIVIVPCAIIIIMESIRIGGIVSARKKEKVAEEAQKQSDKIEELERKLAALQGGAEPSEDSKTQDVST